jgi:hypothetical protein
MEQAMKFNASEVQLSSRGGEYFQVHLSESEAENCPYVLLQNSFEFSRGPAYFECHNLDLAGHGRVKRCDLRRESLEIDVSGSPEHITITFDESQETIANLAWILGTILGKRVSFVNSSGIPESPIEDLEL